ncbi:hypothetical protein [Bacillus thermotolerans]|uniref:hypothetical protein n=1 Tax=Bacillus thermotolerans TaxID=1221996 RepID=UPI00057F2E2A|nr:hypothetical protein [Bacillus thermotolerans]KKB34127.1 hypothetical protein QY97_02639 [Bacillus thermotolerans]
MAENQVIQTEIEGLYWDRNYYAQTGEDSYTLVANKGPLVSDILHFKKDKYHAYFLSIGQINRYTFFGDPTQTIKASFIDCRTTSKTLHKKVEMTFTPDPTKHLYIERGIAEHFENLKNITVRSEPIWFATNKPNGYNLGEDTIVIPLNTPANEFPMVFPNELPLPNEALQFVLKREQEVIKSKEKYRHSVDLTLEDRTYRLSLTPKA